MKMAVCSANFADRSKFFRVFHSNVNYEFGFLPETVLYVNIYLFVIILVPF